MKAIILAAGEGTRLRPYTLDRPKCMVEVDGISLIEKQLNILTSEGVHPVIMIGGYRAEMLRREDITLIINPRYAHTNMVSTLFCAESNMTGSMIVSYGDIVYSREILRALLQSSADIAVAIDVEWEKYWRARNENPLDDAETLRLDKDGRILEIGQKPDSIMEIEGQYMGLMKFSVAGTESLKSVYQHARITGVLRGKPLESAYMTDLLQTLIDTGIPVNSVPVHGGWVEVDTVRDMEADITRSRLRLIN